ncbi:MAG: helix-turn-helix domain-containing protein [Bacteroidales bacterium]|nr:helix-turn-helix domain-containing protein [Bacteroidales bacterium]MCF8398955.1 helix-turn-helix domain-containing protein [Bacteroidales bacterium]
MFIRINLDKALAKRKMTTAELSTRIDVPESNISLLKKSVLKDPRLKMIEKICNKLQVSPGELFDYEKENRYKYRIV